MNLSRSIVQSYNARFFWPRQHDDVLLHRDVDAILGPFLLHVLCQLVAFIRSREMRLFGIKPAISVSCQICKFQQSLKNSAHRVQSHLKFSKPKGGSKFHVQISLKLYKKLRLQTLKAIIMGAFSRSHYC